MVKLSKSEAAKRLGLSRTTLRKYIREGRIDVEPDGKIDTTSLLSRGFTLDTLTRSTDHSADHADQFWPVVTADQFPGHSPGHSPDQLITLLQQQLADMKQELHDAKAEKARLLAIIEGQQRLLEAAKPPPVWPRLKAWVQGRRKAQAGSFS